MKMFFSGSDDSSFDGKKGHNDNRSVWPLTVKKIFSEANRLMFVDRFGLDIWFSFVRLAHDDRLDARFGAPQATITYLTLPDSIKRRHEWRKSVQTSYGENGFGMAVNLYREPSSKELLNFAQALAFLELEVFVHSTQRHDPALYLHIV